MCFRMFSFSALLVSILEYKMTGKIEFIRFTVDCLDWSDGNVFCLSNKASNRSWQNSEDGAV